MTETDKQKDERLRYYARNLDFHKNRGLLCPLCGTFVTGHSGDLVEHMILYDEELLESKTPTGIRSQWHEDQMSL